MITDMNKITEDTIKQAESDLNLSNTTPFSSQAFDALKNNISQYITDLTNESLKISKRYHADTISAAHVEQACSYLISSSSRRLFRHLGTIGGILLGASISTILSMTTSANYTTIGILLSAGFGIIGAFMIALHIAKD